MERPDNYCTMYIVRHGETEWNAKKIVMGHHDPPLTDKGIDQASQLSQDFKDVAFQAAYSSDAFRTQGTAEIIVKDKAIAVKTLERLRERTYGKFEGMANDEFRALLVDRFAELKSLASEDKWTFKLHEGIETDEAVLARFILALREIAIAHPRQNILIVSHSGPIRCLLIHLGYGRHEHFPSGSIGHTAYVQLHTGGVYFFFF